MDLRMGCFEAGEGWTSRSGQGVGSDAAAKVKCQSRAFEQCYKGCLDLHPGNHDADLNSPIGVTEAQHWGRGEISSCPKLLSTWHLLWAEDTAQLRLPVPAQIRIVALDTQREAGTPQWNQGYRCASGLTESPNELRDNMRLFLDCRNFPLSNWRGIIDWKSPLKKRKELGDVPYHKTPTWWERLWMNIRKNRLLKWGMIKLFMLPTSSNTNER